MKKIKDIAEEANVSTGTVDRVLHNRLGVSPKTKEKVEKILKKYNFEKNVLASTLAFKKSFIVATLIPFTKSEKEFWHEPDRGLKAAIKEIRKYGFDVRTFYFDKFDLESFSTEFEKIIELNPNGVLFAPFFRKTSVAFTKELDKKKIPYIFINIDIDSLQNLSFIGQDNFKGGFMAGKLLNMVIEDKDHIIIIRSVKNLHNHNAIGSRTKGLIDYFHQRKMDRNIKQIDVADIEDISDIQKVLGYQLDHDNLIKGVFAPSSSSCMVAKALENIGREDIHLVGFDSHNNLEYLDKGGIDFLIDQNPYGQGYVGLKILFEYLLFNKVPQKKYNSLINIVTKENAEYFKKTDLNEYVL